MSATEIDILHGWDQSPTISDHQLHLVSAVAAGEFSGVFASPACSTWSEAVKADGATPKQVRDRQHPWGIPWLDPPLRARCDQANCMITFTLAVLEAAARSTRMGSPVWAVLEHPEELGRTTSGWAASIWQLRRTRALLQQGFRTMALHQCSFGAQVARPTRMVTNLPGLEGPIFWGLPALDEHGHYLGPLPRRCGHAHARAATGMREDGGRLDETAAFPDELDRWMAAAFLTAAVAAALPPEGQGTHGSSPRKASGTRRVALDDVPHPASWTKDLVYVGRGHRGKGLPPSIWGNPFKVKGEGRQQAVENFREYMANNAELREQLPALRGKTLVCHCGPEDRCHADVLVSLVEEGVGEDDTPDVDEGNEGPPGKRGDGPVGRGPPLSVVRKGSAKEVVDGGGLCSPGKWPLARRLIDRGPAVEELRGPWRTRSPPSREDPAE